MARSVANVKLISASVVDGISNAIYRRGYAAASQGVASSAAKGGVPAARSGSMMKKTGEKTAEKVAWTPDPQTGYYRPENVADEIDVAELRNILLKHKN